MCVPLERPQRFSVRPNARVQRQSPFRLRSVFVCIAPPVSLEDNRNTDLRGEVAPNSWRSDLLEPLPTSSPALGQLHDRLAGDLLERLDDASMKRRVREQIVRMLPNGEPRRSALAKALGVSERTLQRRLADERAHLNVLIESTRRELAQEHLANGRLSMAEVAYLLGFADQSNFFRSFKRWFATSPGEFRRRLREDASRLHQPGPAPDYGATQVGAGQGT
jgi:AraC-like DNA-binding protein